MSQHAATEGLHHSQQMGMDASLVKGLVAGRAIPPVGVGVKTVEGQRGIYADRQRENSEEVGCRIDRMGWEVFSCAKDGMGCSLAATGRQ